jgi:hypothetical protein
MTWRVLPARTSEHQGCSTCKQNRAAPMSVCVQFWRRQLHAVSILQCTGSFAAVQELQNAERAVVAHPVLQLLPASFAQ